MVLDAALINTQHYKVRIKGKVEQSREGVAPSLHLSVVAIEKGAFGSPMTMVANFILILLYMHKPESILENETYEILWDFKIQTDHLISTRRPDLVIINNIKENFPSSGFCSSNGTPE